MPEWRSTVWAIAIGAAGVGQQLAQHGAEGHDDPHVAERPADARLEGEHGPGGAVARQEADEDGSDGEGEEGVQPYCGDEYDDEKDAGGGIEEQPCVVSRHPLRGKVYGHAPGIPESLSSYVRWPTELHKATRGSGNKGGPKHILEYPNQGVASRAPLGTFNSPKMYGSNPP